MGTIFTLSDDIRQVSQTLLDDMLEELGKTARCVYEPIKSECPNCLIAPITNRSSGRYQSGGPLPFEDGQTCPTCEGLGYIITSTPYDDIKVGVSRIPKEFFVVLPPTLILPNGAVQLKTYTTNWGKIKRARYIILAPEQSGIEEERLKLHSTLRDPSNLVPGRYTVGLFGEA
jgi:hypothetical protein